MLLSDINQIKGTKVFRGVVAKNLRKHFIKEFFTTVFISPSCTAKSIFPNCEFYLFPEPISKIFDVNDAKPCGWKIDNEDGSINLREYGTYIMYQFLIQSEK